MKRRSSLPIVGALVVSVLGAGVTRSFITAQRNRLDEARGEGVAQGTNLSNLNSFALGLLLGGLRGPLVMALWTSSENQKTDKNLEDFDTKVELIRLLQPEFDTVHLFQIWNKAYNVSVQMANVQNKYTTILDALAYAFSVDQNRPDDINILAAIGGLYFDKFGGSSDKAYFSSRMAAETLPLQDRVRVTFPSAKRVQIVRDARLSGATAFMLNVFDADGIGEKSYLNLPKSVADEMKKRVTDPAVEYAGRPTSAADRNDSAGHPTQHASLLNDKFFILPQFVQPRADRTATYSAADGSAMPYTLGFEPYIYGVSPYALAYNYYKRCQWLQDVKHVRHAQLAERVLSSRAPMALEMWSQEEWYGADRCEIDLAGQAIPGEDSELQTVTPGLTVTADLPACPLFDQAIWRFNNASRLCTRAAEEYAEHLRLFPDDELTYRSHIEDLTARSHLTAADALYLQVIHATGPEKLKLAQQTADHYAKAAGLYSRYIFRYYLADEEVKDVLPQDFRQLRRIDVDGDHPRLRDDELPAAINRMRAMHAAKNYQLANSIDFKEIDSYIQRAGIRLRNLSLVR